LARALAWQARGGRFESDILHQQYQALQQCEAFFMGSKCTYWVYFW